MKRPMLFASLAVLLSPALAAAASTPPIPVAKFSASSQKSGDGGQSYVPANAFDGLLHTSWAEDKPGLGSGEWLEVDLAADVAVETLSVWGGAFSGREDWKARGRIKDLKITAKGPNNVSIEKSVEFGDRYARKDIAIGATVRTIRLEIEDAYDGAVFSETHIAEVAIDLKKAPDPLWQAEIDKFLAKSKTLKDAPSKSREDLKLAYQNCKDNVDYSANFKALGWFAVHGPEYRVELAQKFIPTGFRLPFFPYDEEAVDLLWKLKDANAIRYFEMAAAGALKGDDRDWLLGLVSWLRAYQDLIRTERATVPNWGSTGMEKGAFNSRGEPLPIDVDSQGNVWAADVGNNRVQRLTAAGTVDKVLGHPEKGVVEEWFGEQDQPYASAAKTGRDPGQFVQPLDLTVGNFDVLAVVDAELQVQTFDSEGNPKAQWKIDSDWKARAGRGNSTPMVTWLDDDFLFLVKDEVFIYSATGELKKRFHLEGGEVQCGVIAAGGRLLVRHVGSRDIVEYTPADGFRQGIWTRQGVPDDGSEDWDMATDEKDNLWVVTDAGHAYVWNKKGKYLKDIQIWDNARDMPRVAVFDTIVYVAAKDEITRIVQDAPGK